MKPDMSPKAITARLRQTSELRRLCLALAGNRFRGRQQSEDFYAALMSGKLAEYDARDESRADFSRWKGIYETWRRRKEAYRKELQEHELSKILRFQLMTTNPLTSLAECT